MSDEFDGEILKKLRLLLAPTAERFTAKPAEVEPGSVIEHLDNRLDHPFLLSHALSGAVTRSYDHLAAINNLLFRAGWAHGWGCMTLARSAIENAAVALWLIGNEDDDIRCQRTLWLSAQDLIDQKAFNEKLCTTVGPDHEHHTELQERVEHLRQRRRRVLRRNHELGLTDKVIDKGLRWGPDILEVVGQEAGFNGLTPHLQWKMLSGLAHGRMWSSLMSLDHEIVGEAGKSVTVKFTTNEEYLYVAVGMAVDLLTRAQGLYDRDRRAPGRGQSFFRPVG